jgi:hypothetical protein
VSFDVIVQYFTLFGAIVACVLGILKILDFYNNRPKLSIRERNCYYEYLSGGTKTNFMCWFEVTNTGRKTTYVKDVVAHLLDSEKKNLTIGGRVFEVEKQLEPNTYVKVNFDLEFDKKMPREKYFVKVEIEATDKVYVHYIQMIYFDDWVEPIFKDEAEGKAKGLL